MIDTIIFSILSFVIGFGLCFIINKITSKGQIEIMSRLQADSDMLSKSLKEKQEECKDLQARVNVLTGDLAAANKEVELAIKSKEEVELRFAKQREEDNQTMRDQFKALSENILKERSDEFNQKSSQHIEHILAPLQENFKKMEEAVEKAKMEQARSSQIFSSQIENLKEQAQKMATSADGLTKALSAESKVQGNWGELVLSKMLELQGLHEGIEFTTQTAMKDADGQTIHSEENGQVLIPDVVLHLDNQKELVIDAKTSLTAYLAYQNAETEDAKAQFLKEHVQSLKKHVDELAKKDYSHYIQAPKKSVDFVMMFVPNESAYQLAMQQDTELWRYAMGKKVFMVSEQNLYTALRVVAVTWSNIRQAENQQKVYELANELISRVGDFLNQYVEIGKKIENLQNAYERTEKKLTTGQSVLSSANKLLKLGAKEDARHQLPYRDIYTNEQELL